MRTARAEPPTINRDEVCILLYVDGMASLGRIAEETGISLVDTIALFLALFRQGIVGEGAPRSLLIGNGVG